MKKTVIQDLNPYIPNERNGTYGGKAGDKEGITINGEYWIVKYPKSTKGMRGTLDSYTTAPLSEYIGSNIYQFSALKRMTRFWESETTSWLLPAKTLQKRRFSSRNKDFEKYI